MLALSLEDKATIASEQSMGLFDGILLSPSTLYLQNWKDRLKSNMS